MSQCFPAYVQRALQKFEGLIQESDGWKACCPCPTHGDDGRDINPSLRLTIGNQGRILVYCRAGCDFYDVIRAAGLRPDQLRPCPFEGDEPAEPFVEVQAESAFNGELDALFDRTYRLFLRHLPLAAEHRRALLARGLSKTEQDLRGYRTLRAADAPAACLALYRALGDAVFQVPGFRPGPGDQPVIRGEPWGMIVPVRSREGLVVALKIRRDEGDPRYLYLTSHPEGRSPGAPPHFPVPPLGCDFSRVRVTEGELKADVATHKSPLYTVSVAGVTNWWRVVQELKSLGVKEALIAFDWRDVRLKTPVAEQLLSFLVSLRGEGIRVGVETWDQRFKGVDDVLAEGHPTAEVWDGVEDFLRRQPSLLDPEKVIRPPTWEPPPFPTDIFPEPVREFIAEVGRALPCPEDFVGAACLTVAGSAVGNSRRVRVVEGWAEQANLYTAIVAPPGSLKTPAFNKVMAPLWAVQQERMSRYDQDIADWKVKVEEHKARLSAYKKLLRNHYLYDPESKSGPKPEPPDPPPPRPTPQHVVVDNVTMERLAEILGESFRGVLQHTDELTALMKLMNAYKGGKGSDRQNYLSMWSCSKIQVDRKTGIKTTLFVSHPFLSILAGIQPDLLEILEEERGREDGFIHRILFSMPKVDPVPPFTGLGVSSEAAARWESVVRALLTLEPAEGEHGPYPQDVPVSVEGYRAFCSWYERHRAEAQEEGFPSDFTGPWSKLKAYCVRFALVLHCLCRASFEAGLGGEDPGEAVRECDMAGAVKLVEYFKSHLRGVFTRFQFDRDDKKIRDFLSWLKSRDGRITLEQVMAHGDRWHLKGRESTRRFLAKVADRGFGHFAKEFPSGQQGRPRDIFELGKGEAV